MKLKKCSTQTFLGAVAVAVNEYKEILKMNDKEMQTFRSLFSDYCFQEINKGHCDEGDCEFCSVNRAYNKIFCDSVDDENDD